jgi:hypothetical protein
MCLGKQHLLLLLQLGQSLQGLLVLLWNVGVVVEEAVVQKGPLMEEEALFGAQVVVERSRTTDLITAAVLVDIQKQPLQHRLRVKL